MPKKAQCNELCPAAEREFRTRHKLIHAMERNADGSITFIKEYVRLSEQSPDSALRTVDALFGAVKQVYAAHKRATSSRLRTSVIVDFVANRFRAVLQDVIVTQPSASARCGLFEEMLPLLFVTEHQGVRDEAFDVVLHRQLADELLQRWAEAYTRCKRQQPQRHTPDDVVLAYFLRSAEDARTLQRLHAWRREGRVSDELARRIARVLLCVLADCYAPFFRLFRAFAPSVQCSACLLVAGMRCRAFCIFARAYHAATVRLSVPYVAKILYMTTAQVVEFCRLYGIQANDISLSPSSIAVANLRADMIPVCTDFAEPVNYVC